MDEPKSRESIPAHDLHTPEEAAKIIAWALSELTSDNAHHEFEHLCRHIARRRMPVPLDEIVLEELKAWRLVCGFSNNEDWVFASEQRFGKLPMWPDSLRTKVLQPTARKVGIAKSIGWHTFRHTYCSLLVQAGNDVRVVQELMRHAKVSTTLEVYTHAAMDTKRVAQKRAVDILLDRNRGTEPRNASNSKTEVCSQDVPA